MAKIAHNGELVPGQRNPPGNWLMGHITSHYIGKHYLGPFKSPSGTISGQCGSKNARKVGQVERSVRMSLGICPGVSNPPFGAILAIKIVHFCTHADLKWYLRET